MLKSFVSSRESHTRTGFVTSWNGIIEAKSYFYPILELQHLTELSIGGSVVGTTYERYRIVLGRSNLNRWIYLLAHSGSGSWIILPLSLLKLCALCICSQSFPDIQRRLNPFNILLSLSCQTFLTSLELGHLFASIRSLGNLPLWGQIFWQIFTTTANGAKNRLKIILLLIMIIDY